MCFFSNDEDEELHSTDQENKEKTKDKRSLCKVKWSRDEVSLGFRRIVGLKLNIVPIYVLQKSSG